MDIINVIFCKENLNRIAVSMRERKMEYWRLDQYSSYIASILKENNIQIGDVVACFMKRSVDILAAILGIWKIGAIYLPIDVEMPDFRIEYIMKNSGAKVILYNIYDYIKPMISMQDILFCKLNFTDETNYHNKIYGVKQKNEDVMYIVYTSGTSGKPKGVMVNRGGMVNHLKSKIDLLSINESSVVAQNANQCFDISIWQFIAPLLVGGRVEIFDDMTICNPRRLFRTIIDSGVTHLEVVPTFLSVMLDYLVINKIIIKKLKYLIVTGEIFSPNLAKRAQSILKNVTFVNAYGPTEASDDVTHFILEHNVEYDTIPIGRVIENVQLYIVGENQKILRINEVGQIVVCGIAVANGYINNKELSEKFFLNELDGQKGRFYLTGDLGYVTEKGIYHYLGRIDNQIKYNGIRIELEELEHYICLDYRIKQAVVKIWKGNEENGDILCAYLSCNIQMSTEEFEDLKKDIIDCLKQHISDKVIPNCFVACEDFVLTANGKIDRKSLPRPSL